MVCFFLLKLEILLILPSVVYFILNSLKINLLYFIFPARKNAVIECFFRLLCLLFITINYEVNTKNYNFQLLGKAKLFNKIKLILSIFSIIN